MAKGGCLSDNELTYESSSSRIEPKRSHQCFMDGPEVELFPYKKQAVEVPNSNLFPGMLNSNISSWGNAPNFQSFGGHVSEQLFDRNLSSVSTEKTNFNGEVNDDRFGNDPSFSLSMSHTLEDPRSGLSYGGFRKVKVNQVKDSENLMNLSVGHSYSRENENTMSATHAFNNVDAHSVSMGLTYSEEDGSVMPLEISYGGTDNNFMSMAQTLNKEEGSLSMGQAYKHSSNPLPTDQSFNKGDNDIMSKGQSNNRADDSNISSCHVYSKGHGSTVSMGYAYGKSDNNMLSIGHSYNKGESTIISFGGCDLDDDDDANTSRRLISNYKLLLGQTSSQQTEATNMQKLVSSNSNALLNTSQITASGIWSLPKKKDDHKMTRKSVPNNFPSNVRSLLSTGMLDGAPVKYMAWSREVNIFYHQLVLQYQLIVVTGLILPVHVRRSFAV